MTETVFTGEEIKKLAFKKCFTPFTTTLAPFPRFAEYFLMGYGPGYTGDGEGQQ